MKKGTVKELRENGFSIFYDEKELELLRIKSLSNLNDELTEITDNLSNFVFLLHSILEKKEIKVDSVLISDMRFINNRFKDSVSVIDNCLKSFERRF